jgi:hypothetical protein
MWTTSGPTAGQKVWTAVHPLFCNKFAEWSAVQNNPKMRTTAGQSTFLGGWTAKRWSTWVKPQVRRGGPLVPPYGGGCPPDHPSTHPTVGAAQ